MSTTVRTFEKTYIRTKPGVDKKDYLRQFALRALSAPAHPTYSRDTQFDAKEGQSTQFDFARLLLNDSELASTIPLVPASNSSNGKFDDLQPEVKRVYESYPLVDTEQISSIKMLCLETPWEGMAPGTLFIERETNFSNVIFAVPRFRVDPPTPGLTPALLLGVGSVSVGNGKPVLLNRTALLGGSDDSMSPEEAAGIVVPLLLDTISTLSWATPAGPFVSAFMSILQAVLGPLFAPKEDLVGTIKRIADDVVQRLENFQEFHDLQRMLDSLKAFAAWLPELDRKLNVQSGEDYKNAVLQGGNVLQVLNRELDPTIENNLFRLKIKLFSDPDLQPGDAYDTPHRWHMASGKLHLLLMTTAYYLIALKLKIAVVARLYENGYDTTAKAIEPTVADPDDTFGLLIDEMKSFKENLPKFIANARSRRERMVVLNVTNTSVAYTKESQPVGDRGQWQSWMNRHDALYRGSYHDQLVRSLEDNPPMEYFETGGGNDCYDDPNCVRLPPTIIAYWWQRTEIQDKVIFDGQHPQDWINSNGDYGTNAFEHQTAKAEGYRTEYVSRILEKFDQGAKLPGILDSGITSLLDKWKPRIPIALPPGVGLKFLAWGGKAKQGDLWSDKTVTVRYRFTLQSTIGHESEKSNDASSTAWIAPDGNCLPQIVGFPQITGHPDQDKYLEYVHSIRVYRQFRREFKNGTRTLGPERTVGVISRGEKGFAAQFVDDKSTDADLKALPKA